MKIILINSLILFAGFINSCNPPNSVKTGGQNDDYATQNVSARTDVNDGLQDELIQNNHRFNDRDVELTILLNSVRAENDSLYFRYRIQNNSDTTFVFYNTGIVDFVEIDGFEEEEYKYYARGLTMFIYDKNGEYQSPTWVRFLPFQDPTKPAVLSYEERIDSLFYGKYVMLPPGKSVEYDRHNFMDICELEKGIYNLQLRYYSSSDRYEQQYANAREKNARIKNSILFEGEIRSNFCSFEIVETMQKSK